MLFRASGAFGVISAAVALVAAAYLAGAVVGRWDGNAPPEARGVIAAEPEQVLPPAAAGGGTSSVRQPITASGRPPLANVGSGPFGSRRTTGADYVALTFDDGPDPRWTPEVLALLRTYDVRATFCVVGVLAEAHPDLMRAIADGGHTLCNHSWQHDFGLGDRSREAIRADLERTNAAIRAAVPGTRVSYYRQPGGRWTPRVIEVAEDLGMSSLHWDVDPQDWRRPGAGAIAATVTSSARRGSIVLLHDGGGERAATVQALRTILPNLSGRVLLDALPPGADPPRMHGRELPLKPGQI